MSTHHETFTSLNPLFHLLRWCLLVFLPPYPVVLALHLLELVTNRGRCLSWHAPAVSTSYWFTHLIISVSIKVFIRAHSAYLKSTSTSSINLTYCHLTKYTSVQFIRHTLLLSHYSLPPKTDKLLCKYFVYLRISQQNDKAFLSKPWNVCNREN